MHSRFACFLRVFFFQGKCQKGQKKKNYAEYNCPWNCNQETSRSKLYHCRVNFHLKDGSAPTSSDCLTEDRQEFNHVQTLFISTYWFCVSSCLREFHRVEQYDTFHFPLLTCTYNTTKCAMWLDGDWPKLVEVLLTWEWWMCLSSTRTSVDSNGLGYLPMSSVQVDMEHSKEPAM